MGNYEYLLKAIALELRGAKEAKDRANRVETLSTRHRLKYWKKRHARGDGGEKFDRLLRRGAEAEDKLKAHMQAVTQYGKAYYELTGQTVAIQEDGSGGWVISVSPAPGGSDVGT